MRHSRLHVLLALTAIGGGLLPMGVASAAPDSDARTVQQGGLFRIVLNATSGIDFMDPALASTPPAWALLDTTCARLMSYPDRKAPAGFRVDPEVATDFPKVSRDGRTYTFTLRKGFRFSDGTALRADAFARAIDRLLAPEMKSPGVLYARDIVGAGRVVAGKATHASGVVARERTLTVRLTRPTPDFLHRTASTFFCAVPPTLPVDPEGRGAFHAAGPYYVTEYRRGERVVIRRNRFYGGSRPHHVDGFDVDLRAPSPQDVLKQVDRGEADWGHTLPGIYFGSGLGLVEKYGINKTRLFLRPGLTLRLLSFNMARPLFRDNRELRRAVNFALDRSVITTMGGQSVGVPTDQYLPRSMPGFRNADIYPLERANLRRARNLAKGNLRGGKARLFVAEGSVPMAIGQLIRQQLARIGLDVQVVGIPIHSATAAYYRELATPGKDWDLAFGLWSPSYNDPYAYINLLFDGRFVGATNYTRFSSGAYDRLMRRAARLPEGHARNRAYAELDASLARQAAPTAPIDFLHEPTLVSDRVGCVVLRPLLDLTSVCLQS